MHLPPFLLKAYLSRWKNKASHPFCCSEAQPFTMKEVLALADTECLTLWENLSLGGTFVPGSLLLRQEIAKTYRGLQPEHIFTFTGAEEAIFAAMHAIVQEGDDVIVATPCYQSLITLPEVLGATVSPIPLDPNKGWNLDAKLIIKALKPNTRLIVLNSPHNPTGALIDPSSFQEIVQIAKGCGAYILSDEVNRGLEYSKEDLLPSAVELYEKGVSIGSLSNAFGLEGLRIGWVASRHTDLLLRALAFKQYTSVSNSAPSEILSLIALRNKESLLKRNKEIVLKNIELLARFFSEYSDIISWTHPRGGCNALVKLLFDSSIDKLAEQWINDSGVLVVPGTVYGLHGPYFSIGFGQNNLEETLACFKKSLDALLKERSVTSHS